MKIAIVCPYNYFIPGGVQEHVKAQSKELISRGYEVAVITPRPRNHKLLSPENVIFAGQSARVRTLSNTSADVSISVGLDEIDEILEREKFDIIHLHEPAIPLLGRQILNKAKVPTVGTFHAAPPNNMVGRSFISTMTPYNRSFAKAVDAITVVSPAAAEMLGEDFDYHTISNGVDLSLYKPPKTKRDPDMILYVGRLEKRKGPKHLLDAYRMLKKKRPSLHLEIAGDGPLRRSLQEYCEYKQIPDVVFHGYVSQEDKRELMGKCGVFTSPALYGESFGIVVVEAMAMGAPVVAGDNPGYATVMTGRGSLSLVDPRDTTAYARLLELFIIDQEFVELWRKWSMSAVKEFDWPKVVDKYVDLYDSLVDIRQ